VCVRTVGEQGLTSRVMKKKKKGSQSFVESERGGSDGDGQGDGKSVSLVGS
jgi:hypothetical protein